MYETTVPVFKLNLWAERSTCRNFGQSWNIKDLKEVEPGGLPGEAADSEAEENLCGIVRNGDWV